MRPTELKELLKASVEANLPVLVKGAPGIGKSDIIEQVAEETDSDLVISHPVVSDPTDFKGLPGIVDGKAEFLPFGDLRKLISAKKRTICFLDDLGQAPAVVQAAAMQLLLARQINGHKISDKIVFVAATNRRQDRAGVMGILEPVKSRFASIVELKPEVEDWVKWAIENDVNHKMIAFIRFRPALLFDNQAPSGDIVNKPSPRTVTFASKFLDLGVEDLETIAGSVGEGFAAELLGFLKFYHNLPDFDAILLDPTTAQIPNEPAALFAVATGLASKMSTKNAARIIKYANRLPQEYSILCVRDGIRHCPEAVENQSFIRWADKHQDILV